ncbi:hypothetical protein [Absidia glauca]|uniref:Tudor domain-containing protein n=1 Tax=Absidia glauca TaxID=4829 RepID=A0A168QZY5_ABSGL|nr:hypothetical protein [Absidia glauca]
MGDNESEAYHFQLEQVEHALAGDPTNEELLTLQRDLKELIALTTQYEQVSSGNNNNSSTQPPPSDISGRKRSRSPSLSSPSTDTTLQTPPAKTRSVLAAHQFSVGQEVKAKWSQDGQYYKATITAIGGADQIFSVQFRGYKDIEVVSVGDIEPLEKDKRKGIFEGIKGVGGSNNSGGGGGDSDSSGRIGVSVGDDGSNGANKKKKTKKVSEVEVKKNAWLNFAGGGDKKKKKQKVAPINKKSIFKTPDNPESKVGVVGSGRGMTSYQQRGKHSFTNSLDEE